MRSRNVFGTMHTGSAILIRGWDLRRYCVKRRSNTLQCILITIPSMGDETEPARYNTHVALELLFPITIGQNMQKNVVLMMQMLLIIVNRL